MNMGIESSSTTLKSNYPKKQCPTVTFVDSFQRFVFSRIRAFCQIFFGQFLPRRLSAPEGDFDDSNTYKSLRIDFQFVVIILSLLGQKNGEK